MIFDFTEKKLLGRISAGDVVTDDLHEGWFGINPSIVDDEFWNGATITIQKIQKDDPVTGKREKGEVRFYATWGTNEERLIEPYDWRSSITQLTMNPPINLVGPVYGSATTIPPEAKYWIEGIYPGKITLEWRLQKDDMDVRFEQTFEIFCEWTRDEWLSVVRDELYLDSFTNSGGPVINELPSPGLDIDNYAVANDFLNNRKHIYQVYEFYAKLHDRHDGEKFLWAGLAKLAGAPVYAGLSDAQNGRDGIALGTFGFVEASGLKAIQDLLIGANIAIYEDLAYQFVVYRTSGIRSIEHLESIGDIDPANLAAWTAIENGDLDSGNQSLLQREQQVILDPTYISLGSMAGGLVSWFFSVVTKNPLPGGPSFETVVPEGLISIYSHRWQWITDPAQGMWKLWNDASRQTRLLFANIRLIDQADTFNLAAPLR